MGVFKIYTFVDIRESVYFSPLVKSEKRYMKLIGQKSRFVISETIKQNVFKNVFTVLWNNIGLCIKFISWDKQVYKNTCISI